MTVSHRLAVAFCILIAANTASRVEAQGTGQAAQGPQSSAITAPAEPTILGITIGKPLQMPRCIERIQDDNSLFGSSKKYFFEDMPPNAESCFAPDPRNPTSNVIRYSKPLPDFIAGNDKAVAVSIVLKGPSVIANSLLLLTTGQRSQELVLAELKEKFGPPAALSTDTVQNGYGAKYDSIHARWHFSGGAEVTFQGIGASLNYGSINLESAEAYEADRERQKESDAARVKF